MSSVPAGLSSASASLENTFKQNRDAHDRLLKRENPFVYDEVKGHETYETIKTVVVGLTLLPLRLILILMCMIFMAILSKLVTSFGYDPTQPMSETRRFFLLEPRKLCMRIILFACGVYWLDIEGAPSDDARFVVVAPHSTFLDQFIVAFTSPGCAVAKKEVTKVPLFNHIFQAGQTIYVDRQDKESKRKVLDEFKRRALDKRWDKVVLFPEGTCTNRKAMISFRTGAFSSGLPVQPLLIEWSFKYFDPTWTAGGTPSRGKLILRLLCQFSNHCKVRFLPVQYPNEVEKKNPIAFANNTRNVMAKAAGSTVTEHSYMDAFMALEARKDKLDPAKTLDFEFSTLQSLLTIDAKNAQNLLHRFSAAKSARKTGKLTIPEFADVLNVPLTNEVIDLFGVLDVEGSGELDFKEFLVGMTFLSQNIDIEQSCKILFKLLDPKDTKQVSMDDVSILMERVFSKKLDPKIISGFFAEIDAEKSGYLNYEQLLTFMTKHPEYLHLGLQMGTTYKLKGNKIKEIDAESVLMKNAQNTKDKKNQ